MKPERHSFPESRHLSLSDPVVIMEKNSQLRRDHLARLAVTGVTLVGVLLMLVALGTDYWIILYVPVVRNNVTESFVNKHHSGLWRICRDEVDNTTKPVTRREYCQMLKLFPSKEEVNRNPEIDYGILDYSRTETAFAVIALGLMLVGHVFAIYTFKEPRYMFKRITALMHLMTTVCVLVSVEVMINSVGYERQNLPARHPKGAYITYGFSFYLAWIVFGIYLIATIVFVICSKKKKGSKAYSEDQARENEPVHLGRV